MVETPNITELWPGSNDGIKRVPTIHEALREFRLRRGVLIQDAIEAEPWGYSWRPEPVKFGCAILAARPGYTAEDRFGIFTGSNCTLTSLPRPFEVPKMCAERVAVWNALWAGYCLIIGGALFSRHMQFDDISKKFFHTPHACYECTDFFELVLTPYARFVTARPRYLACDVIDVTDPWRDTDLVVEEEDYFQIVRNHLHEHQGGHGGGQ